jgi:flagellar basal body rod protein FlgF
MRSTRASAAVDRLKRRSGNPDYSMVRSADGLFHLTMMTDSGDMERLSPSLEQDAFVEFVNAYGPQTPKKVSKLDVAFEKQLARKKPAS